MTDTETIKARVNISITGEDAIRIEKVREGLEKHLKQRLSIAQVTKRLYREAELALETNNNK
jgi:hypothetical protein